MLRFSSARLRRSVRLAAIVLAGAAGAAQAGPLAYEGFAYAMAQPLPTMGGPFGWSAPWIGSTIMRAFTPPLAYPSALPSSGLALQNPAVGEGWRTFVGGLVNNAGDDLWISFMERSAIAGSGAFVSVDPPAAFPPSIVVNKTVGGVITISAGGPAVFGGFSAGVGAVDFFVIHLTQWNGISSTLEFYLNPGVALGPPSAVILVPSPLAYNLDRFYYRSDAGQYLDEIRVGTTLPDVAAAQGGSGCYANCDGSVAAPCLNVNDFSCFLNRYAAGDPYANCDGSTTPPVLNVNDFSCFLNKFAAGCPGC